MTGREPDALDAYRRYGRQMTANQPAPVEGTFTEIPEDVPSVPQARAKNGGIAFPDRPIMLVPRDPEGAPWDLMRGEAPVWHARFELFRQQGPERTMARAYRVWLQQEHERSGRPLPLMGLERGHGQTPPAWWRVFRAWRWRERADAWDQAQIEDLRRAEADRVRQATIDRINTGRSLRAKGVRALTAMPDASLKPAEALMAIKLGDDLIAKGLGMDKKENQNQADTIHVKVLDLGGDDEPTDGQREAYDDAPTPALAAGAPSPSNADGST